MTKKYNFKYQMTTDTNNGKGFAKDEVKTIAKDHALSGVTDGLFFASVIREEMDGGNTISLKISFNSIGMESAEKFCTWCLMARNLLKDPSLPKFARDIYEHAVKQFGKFEKEIEKENINRSTANDSK